MAEVHVSSVQLKVLNKEMAVHLVRDALKRGTSQKDEHGNAKDSKANSVSQTRLLSHIWKDL